MHEPHIRPTVEQDVGLVVPVDAQYVTLTPARLQVLDEAKLLRAPKSDPDNAFHHNKNIQPG